MRTSQQHLLSWPVCLLGAAAAALLFGMQLYLASEADAKARVREETVVANGVSSYVNELARKAVPQTVWDDAVENLDRRFNPSWAQDFIGVYFSETEGFDAALVLDRDDDVRYAMRRGRTVNAADVSDLAAAAAPLLAAVRAAEARRGPVGAAVARGETRSAPILASAITRIGADVYILSASLVQPDFGTVLPLTARSAVVVSGKRIDQSVVAALADRFLLSDARLNVSSAQSSSGRARALFRHDAYEVVGALEWSPPRPGAALLGKTLPPMFVFVAALAALAWGLFLRNRRATERLVASEARASHLAYHDTLTGLPNRAKLADALGRSIQMRRRGERPFAVHCIDLDRFKEVNDTFGHQAGDELIQIVARTLASTCRETDLLVRLGGDEFAILQDDATPETAGALSERVVKLLAEPIDLQAGRVFIGASVGVAYIDAPECEPQDCLRQADLALYQAKDGGRGQFAFFEPDLDAAVKARRALQVDLRDALIKGDLALHYQPQMDGRGAITGLEALVRWNHAERGEVSPATFVQLAEETGLIETLGLFTLRRAFEESVMWGDLKVAVNVSAAQVRMRDFVPRLRELVDETGVSPAKFELEITEGLLLGDDPQVCVTLQQLRDMGFRIALDDFGAGYSSLGCLQRYPIDKVKIDRSFVARLGMDREAEAVISAIIRLARAFGLAVIAEGVETHPQRLRLAAAGCTDIQGFLTGKPMSAADAAVLVQKNIGSRSPERQRQMQMQAT